MIDDTPPDRAAIQRLMRRLDGFARGLDLDEATVRQIVERVITDMPDTDEVDRQAEARNWMLLAARGAT